MSQIMERQTEMLFDISKQVKHFYETPIVYVNRKDYGDIIFNAMCTLRTALGNNNDKLFMDTIVDCHLQWLHAVNEIDTFKKITGEISREHVYQAISYTIDALTARLKYFHRYMESNRSPLSNSDQAYLDAELEIVESMHIEVTHALLEKLKCFRNFDAEREFKIKLDEATDDLLHWLDKMCDSLFIQLCNYVNLNIPQLNINLTRTLEQIVDNLRTSETPSAVKMREELKIKGQEISSMIRCTAGHHLEISTVIEKINILDDRIKRLQNEPKSAVMALSHKKEYLANRLLSLENMKKTVKSLQSSTDFELEKFADEKPCVCEDFFTLRIFNHALPLDEREKLITELCFLWDSAVFGERKSRKSIISILSATEMKEEFVDELGTYFIDEYSRKVYKIPDDDILYQPNELNVLIPLSDDEEHIFFYDECGRYYIDPKSRQRVYKAHKTASEYMMDSTGILLKIREERDGITYYYDNYGRYFIDEEGKHVYRETDNVSEYEHDGLGNLVRIRSHPDMFNLCPGDANVTEDFNYLKQSVGKALRESIANCILHQPDDPIKFLSSSLRKYRENMQIKEKRALEKEELNALREEILAEERAAAEKAAMEAALLAQGGSETSFDSNLVKYTSMHHVDTGTISVASTKL